jgi:hypothetical protein
MKQNRKKFHPLPWRVRLNPFWRYGIWKSRRMSGPFWKLGHYCTFCHKLIRKADDCVSLGHWDMIGGRASCRTCIKRYDIYFLDDGRLEHWGWESFLK